MRGGLQAFDVVGSAVGGMALASVVGFLNEAVSMAAIDPLQPVDPA